MLDLILDAVVGLSPLAIAAMSVLVGMSLAKSPPDKSQKRWRWVIIGLGVVCSGVSLWQQARGWRARSVELKAHSLEVNTQRQAIDQLQAKLDAAEIRHTAEIKYLEGQFSVFSQVGPAVVKLAQMSQENIREQYGVKGLSDSQLREFASDVVKRMRDLASKHKQIQEQQFTKNIALQWQNKGQGKDARKMEQIRDKEIQEYVQEDASLEYQFKSTILGDAVYARNELLRRIGRDQPSIYDPTGVPALQGFLAGPDPVGDAANYLERLAKQL